MTTTQVDTTPVMATPAGAAMNAMFAENSVQTVPTGPAVTMPGQQPQVQTVQPTPDGAAPPQVIDPSQPDSLIPFHHQQQMLQQMVPGQELQPGQTEQPPAVDPNAPPRQPDGEMVPVGRFRQVIAQRNAEADRYRALEADFNRLAGYVQAMMAQTPQQGQQSQPQQAQQPQVQIPDPGLDPAGFVRAMQEQTQQMVEAATRQVQTETQRQLEQANAQVRHANMKASEAAARATFGPQAPALIKAATTAAVQAGLKDQFMSGPDPVGSAIRWYQQQVTQQRYGADPNTVRARVGAELMRDPQFVQQVAQQLRQGVPPQQRAAIPPPPSAIPRAGTATPSTMYSNGGQAVAQLLAQRMMQQGMRAN